MPAVWTRGELKHSFHWTDEKVESWLAEIERAAKIVNMPSPLTLTGEGDDQLISMDDEFYRVYRQMMGGA